ncbi:MAG: hypothetical protein IAF08_02170 [Rhizobacter sp.]|nr:hypothetical protein [Chlorobiales bacterium]
MNLASCNLFTPRDPESPQTEQANWQLPVTIDLLISNFRNAFGDRNLLNYMRSFSPEPTASAVVNTAYVFIPTAESPAGIFAGWNTASEENFFRRFSASIKTGFGASLLLTEIERTQSPQQAQIEFMYRLRATYTDAALGSESSGKMLLTLSQSAGGTWFISQWQDVKDTSSVTFSELKRQLR